MEVDGRYQTQEVLFPGCEGVLSGAHTMVEIPYKGMIDPLIGDFDPLIGDDRSAYRG
jgi:hypothetical protein